jgi:hypothetical protein
MKWAAIAAGKAAPPTAEELESIVRQGRCDGVAALMGVASQNAEMVEVEGRVMPRFGELEAHADAVGLGRLFHRLRQGCVERTPSGGQHFYLRVSDGLVAGNIKLALRPGVPEPTVLAETRGQGGYSIVAASAGQTHETGGAWEMIAGCPANTPTFTMAEVEDLHRLFRILDEMPVVEPRNQPGGNRRDEHARHGGDLSPGDDFNQRAAWDDLLEGWTKVREVTEPDGTKKVYWRRPGKSVGTSATVLGDGKWLYNFSSSVALPTEQALSKFGVYTYLHHERDFSAAAAELAREGYGQRAAGGPRAAAHEVMDYRPFPVNALPPQFRQFVEDGAAETGCDPSYIALPAFAALGSAIGNTRRLKIRHSWSVPPIIWSVSVGESGNQKTTGYQLALKPIHQRQKQALERYEAEFAQYEKQLEQWEREKNSGRRLPPHRQERPTPPIAERILVGDTTVEALAPLLKGNPRGLLIARDELRGWLGSFDRYAGNTKGKSDEAHWLSMYNGGTILVDRKTAKDGPIHVPCAAVCVTGGIQPGTLRRALGSDHRDSGLAARLLMSYPPRRPKEWTDAAMRPEVEQEYAALFSRLYGLQPAIGADNGRQPVELELTPQAKDLYVAYYNAHNLEAATLTGDLASAWSKLEETAARLALIIEFVSWAGSGRNTPPTCISARSMGMAITLAEWFKHETRRVYAEVLADTGADRKTGGRDKLIEWLSRQHRPVTASEVQKNVRHLRESGQAEAALQDLVKSGEGEWVEPEPGKRGQPTRRFRLLE